ncbi:MAG: TetR/AcrR family transcriptional regulator [Acidobacteria bacterium]|mgnify:CR=1 FL=1|nr:TetR/AcrR family transcriptional regulator [Acidobacteriota bacterium]
MLVQVEFAASRGTVTMDVREQLLEAAVKVFANAGFRGATTRRIAQEAGVNEVTLFRQFGSKEGLITEAVLRVMERLRDEAALPAVPVDPAAELLDWTARHYDFVLRHHRLIKAAMADVQSHPDMACIGDRVGASTKLRLQSYLDALCTAGLCDADLDTAVATNVLTGVVFADAMGRDVQPHCYPYPPDEAPQRYVAFFLRAIGARAAGPASAPDTVVHHG